MPAVVGLSSGDILSSLSLMVLLCWHLSIWCGADSHSSCLPMSGLALVGLAFYSFVSVTFSASWEGVVAVWNSAGILLGVDS